MIREFKNIAKNAIAFERIKFFYRIQKMKNKTKIFCIGFNKTGTKSLIETLSSLGLNIAPLRPGELLFDDWKIREFENLKMFCDQYQAFKDIPFSLPETYKFLDKMFPKSKFILTIRDDSVQWYNSISNFHGKLFGQNGKIPTRNDLMNASYVRKGYVFEFITNVFKTTGDDLYNKRKLTEKYEEHNQEVINFFKDKKGKLLVINLNSEDSFKKLCVFLDIKSSKVQEFLWLNKTSNL